MKFTAFAVAALSASLTQAVAVPEPEANPSPEAWCRFKGEGCWKVKRAADAFADSITSSGGVKWSRAAEISNHRGGAAYNAKRSLDELAALVASAFPDSDSFYETVALYNHFGPDANLTEADGAGGDDDDTDGPERRSLESAETKRHCLFKGEGCWKREAAPWCRFKGEGCWKRAVPMTAREAEADPHCLFKGEGCWKRSEETAEAGAVEKREASPWCRFKGEGCWKREAAAAPAFCPFGGEAGSTCYASKRDFAEADKRSCEQPGEACHKARRAAEALISAIDTAEPAKRDVDVEARWCRFKGEGCWKRDAMDSVVARCNEPSGACTAARRDLVGLHAAARSVIDSLDADVE